MWEKTSLSCFWSLHLSFLFYTPQGQKPPSVFVFLVFNTVLGYRNTWQRVVKKSRNVESTPCSQLLGEIRETDIGIQSSIWSMKVFLWIIIGWGEDGCLVFCLGQGEKKWEETLGRFSGGDDAKLDLEGSTVRKRRKNILSRSHTDITQSILGKTEKHM